MAGVACGNLGDLENGITYSRTAAEIAEQAGDGPAAARAMGMVASYQKRSGRFDDCLATIRALSEQGRSSLTVQIVQAECCQELGRFDDAERTLVAAWKCDELVRATIPQLAKRQAGVISLSTARLHVEQGRLSDAWDRLQDAIAAFRGDEKLTLWCEATGARLCALLGRRDDAAAKMAYVMERMPQFSSDRHGTLSCAWNLAMTTQALGDDGDALVRWDNYLALTPDPVALPRAYFHMGECHAALGHAQRAREYWTKSVDCGIPTYHAGLAREKLTWM
jgi:tetratricopeptide (TPR) repeat protein